MLHVDNETVYKNICYTVSRSSNYKHKYKAMNAVQDAKKRGWPLTTQEIIMERVQYEERFYPHLELAEKLPKMEIPKAPSNVALLYNWVKSNVRMVLNP